LDPETHVLRRAQTWLGTLVEIRAAPGRRPAWQVLSAIDEAFREVADIHRLLSRQQDGRDFRVISVAGPGTSVRVDPRTVEVLEIALALRDRTGGRFDPDGSSCARTGPGRSSAWKIMGPQTIAVVGRGNLDLDGIAKGYAVDRAVAVMKRHRIPCVVNAGGDMRCSGGAAEPVHVRSSLVPGRLLQLGAVHDLAIACSNTLADDGAGMPLASTGIHDPRDRRRFLARRTVCVAAPSCAVADALTKAVAVDTADALPTLESCNAVAWVIESVDGRTCIRRYGENQRLRHAA
jgi:FAD:protein FMN transferase